MKKSKELQNVHKMVYLANEYPDKPIQGIAALFELSPLDINNAAWRAEDLNYLIVDKDTGKFTVADIPRKWDFGPELETLKKEILYYMEHIARTENDLEEVYMSNVTAGYPAHDITIAMKQLLNDRRLATYELTTDEPVDPKRPEKGTTEETYTFYSLWENVENRWGEKQFKKQQQLK